jgi:hypothetical protein
LHERGFKLIAPIHDAVVLEASATDAEEASLQAEATMEEASQWVLENFMIRTEAKIIYYPGRYDDERGRPFWELIQRHLPQHKRENHA